jgi:hypothetical protein
MIAGDVERSFDEIAVERAAERAKVTTIEDKEVLLSGQLAGILPDRPTQTLGSTVTP